MRVVRLLLPVLVVALTTTPATLVLSASPASAAVVAGAGFTPPLPLNDASGASTSGSEPSIAVDSHDNVYVSAPAGVPTGGCPFWNVHKDGLGYDYRGTMDTDQGSVGGGDCDISTLPVPGGQFDDVSVTSLSLANLTSNVTMDGGETWEPVANSASQQIFGVDRQWQASDAGLGRHYLTVHDLATSNIQTSVSIDGGYQYVQNTPAIRTDENPGAGGTAVYFKGTTPGGNHFGPTVVNPLTHKLYIPFIAAAPPETGGTEHAVWVAEGDACTAPCVAGAPAGPIVWNNYPVYIAPAGLSLANDFPAITIDPSGVVYVGFTGDIKKPATASSTAPYKVDTNRIFLSHSRPGDVSSVGAWSAPQAVDPGTANANVFPWLASGATGNVGIAWYTSTLAAATTCPGAGSATNDPVSDNCRNLWNVAYAQSSNADTATPDWTVSDVSGLVHKGPICNQGLSCPAGTRTMLDFFDVAVDSHGRPNFAYVSDTRSLNTADVQYGRQCSGTSLTGETLSGCAAGGGSTGGGTGGVVPNCLFPQITDPTGDATQVFGLVDDGQTAASQPDLDIVNAGMTWDASKVALVAHIHVVDLAATPGSSEYMRYDFKLNNTLYELVAKRDSTGATSFFWTLPALGASSISALAGSFDNAANLVTIELSADAYAAGQPSAAPLGTGSVIDTMSLLTQRIVGAATSTADSAAASATCVFAVGATADPVVPEVPYAALLPIVGLGLMGLLYRRRRSGTSIV
jgi:hypothetical protein